MTFNDRPIYSCYMDGQTFTDPGVYAQHMLMQHGVIISVTNQTGKIVIPAPVNPIVPPINPAMTIAPGVTYGPAPGGGPNLVITTNPTIAPASPTYTAPIPTSQAPVPVGSSVWSGSGSVAVWAWAGIIASMFMFQRRSGKKRRTTRAK
jgi:hypothetical protein